MAGRQLQLARRENFFSDPFFSDFMSLDDVDFNKRLSSFKQRSSALALSSNRQEAAHNLQVSASNDKFMVQLELPGFLPEDFSLKTKDDIIVLEAIHQSKSDGDTESTSRKFVREFKMPEGVQADQINSSYSSDGILTIQAPRVIKAPEGATVQEAMAAASKAYTTDDGKTSVKQDSSSASQMIAATTESPDGSTKSSMSFSSSSSSSSSMMTSSSGGPIPALSIGTGGSGGSLEMDDMMKKMMEGMKMGSGSLLSGSSSSKMSSMSSSSFSSSSTSAFSSSSKAIGGGFGGLSGMPSFGEIGFPKLDIEELSTAGTDITGPPSYTVTSPRPSVDNTAAGTADFIRHLVKPTADFKAQAAANQADHTVLLKLRQGDEYKLVLNMQQYSPENITVKLNGNDLTVTASLGGSTSNTDDFKQVHNVPEGIDLDQLTSSFSADGVLVIKAPRKK